ncbi:unnamed protein product, partial [Rotaria sp. Silwood2]
MESQPRLHRVFPNRMKLL